MWPSEGLDSRGKDSRVLDSGDLDSGFLVWVGLHGLDGVRCSTIQRENLASSGLHKELQASPAINQLRVRLPTLGVKCDLRVFMSRP